MIVIRSKVNDHYVRLSLDLSVIPCQYEHVHRAGEPITHMLQWRHHMTTCGLKLSSLHRHPFLLFNAQNAGLSKVIFLLK